MTQKINTRKATIIGLFALILSSLSFPALAVSSTKIAQNTITENVKNTSSNFEKTMKRNFRIFKKITTKKLNQLKKEYNEMGAVKKIAWGIAVILIGVLVTLGGLLSLSGWGFVLGLGLIILGALKIVFGLLGVVF